MGMYVQLEMLVTAGKLNFSFAVFLKCGISTVSHVVLSTVRARRGFSAHRDIAFLGICAENTTDNFWTCLSWWNSNGSYGPTNPVFHYLWVDFQHTHSLRENLIQERLCMRQEPLEIVRWHFIIVPMCHGWFGTCFETNSQGSFYFL